MAKLPDNVSISIQPGHEIISNCHWDEESQLYRVTVDGFEFVGLPSMEQLQVYAQLNRRRAAAFEAMARCAEARENRQKAGESDRSRIRSEVMAEAGYFGTGDRAYQNLGVNNPQAQRAVDLAVEARLKLEREGRA